MTISNKSPISRRDFMVTLLATGFALSVRPISAKTITTDSNALVSMEIKIPVADGEIPAYLAYPEKGSDLPVVLVVQEIFGVHEHIKDVCRRLAKLGYLAIAPELFARQGDVSSMTDIKEIISKVVSKVPDTQVMADLDATVNWVSNHTKGDTSHLAITGFCWGGRITWLYCAHNPQIKAGIAWYGKLTGPTSELQTTHPIDIAPQLKVPVLGLYGGKDNGIPLDSVEKMKTLLAAGDSQSNIQVYPEASHAFFADYRLSYNKEAAEDGWKKLQDWLTKHLK
ncbi:MAG: carboxymethylenebutenolidase [Betaproteobacteria bacterium HGW-Betaproteobacteria-20]|nr:MAG: carboxymethylenebutenolidase [Betaproteobacteria bacterium HGW-Betaproteobacteria-20]